LCLGYKADVIKQFFLITISVCPATLRCQRQQAGAPQGSDISDWKITCVDTGLRSNIGQRLKAVEKSRQRRIFLANYADALTDLHLPDEIERKQAARLCFCLRQALPEFLRGLRGKGRFGGPN
jgi:glucose-1-phosphate cytidylyltransferase